MQKEDISFLRQLIKALEDTEFRLRRAYEERDSEKFNEIKSFMLRIQKQIGDILK